MQAILHIGIEKTGTTTIQEFIQLNRTLLREQGVRVLDCAGFSNNWKFATFAMNPDKTDDLVIREGIESIEARKKWRDNFKSKLNEELASGIESDQSVLISSEHLHSRLVTVEEVDRIKSLLSPYFSDFKIVVYLRRQDKLALSSFSTYYKAGGVDSLLDRLAAQANTDLDYYDFDRLLEKWSEVFGVESVVPRIFSRKSFHQQNLLADFIEACNLSNENMNFESVDQQNSSLSKGALEALRSFNMYFPADDSVVNSRNNLNLRAKFVKTLETEHSGVPQVVSRETAEGFVNQFADSNARVAQRWFNRAKLFNDDYSMYDSSQNDFSDPWAMLNTVMQFFKENDLRYFTSLQDMSTSQNKAELLRDIALLVENENPFIACFLMEEADRHLPGETSICSKLEVYKKMGFYSH